MFRFLKKYRKNIKKKYLKAIDDNKLLIVYKSVNFQEKKRVIVEGKINLAKLTEKVTEKRMNTLI